MLGKLAVLCFCLALASAKPARTVRFSSHHSGLVKSCNIEDIIDAAETIAEQTSTFAVGLAAEIAKIKTDADLCTNPLDILLCATEGVPGILKNSALIVAKVKKYVGNVSTEVPALISDINDCLYSQ